MRERVETGDPGVALEKTLSSTIAGTVGGVISKLNSRVADYTFIWISSEWHLADGGRSPGGPPHSPP